MNGLRPYQLECVERILRELGELQRPSTIAVMATGTGKTRTAAEVLRRWRARGRILWLAHRSELLEQAAGAIREHAGLTVGIEQAERAVDRSRLPDVVVASVQTLRGPRLQEFPREAFTLVVVDEAHHATADSYSGIVEWFRAQLLGLTATPFRSDGEQLSQVFQSVAYEYRIRDAIRDGWLVPVRRRVEQIPGLDLTAVRGVRDFTDEDLARALDTDPLVREVARRIVAGAGTRPTIVFGPTVGYVQRLMSAINAITAPGRAVALDGTAPDEVRRPVIDGFKARAFRVLGNCALFTEGTDLPLASCIALVRPTKSAGLAEQMIGRGLRLSADTGKRDCLVIEIAGRVKAGVRVVGALEVVGAREPSAVRALAGKMLLRDPSLDVSSALDRAARPVAGPARAPARQARPGGSLMQVALRLRGIVLEPATAGAPPANAMQIAELEKAGLDATGLTIRQASVLLEGLRWRREHRLSSPKQALHLLRAGYEPDCSAGEAGRVLAKLFGTGGRHAASSGGGGHFATPTLRGIR